MTFVEIAEAITELGQDAIEDHIAGMTGGVPDRWWIVPAGEGIGPDKLWAEFPEEPKNNPYGPYDIDLEELL